MKVNPYFWRFALIAFLASSGIFLWDLQSSLHIDILNVNKRLESKDTTSWTASVSIGSTMPHFELSSLNGDVISSEAINAQLTLLVFFSPDDCPSCLLEAKLWRDIDRTYEDSDVTVLGITTAPIDTYKMTIFKRGRHIDFPILLDPAGEYKGTFGITNTPTKVLVDNLGRIIDASASGQLLVEHKLYKEKIVRLLEIL